MKRFILLLIASGALLAPTTALASGVVLKVQKTTHLVAVTNGKTKVSLVHTAATSRLHVGQRVALTARKLRNGTFSASSVRVVGRTHKVHFRATLLKKNASRFVVSAGGAVISLKRSRATASARDTGTPQPGTVVDVTATVNNDDEDMDEEDITTVDADHPGGAIEGKLTIGTGKITVVSGHMALVLTVPAGFDLTQFKTGDEVLAQFTQGADGTLTLSKLSSNDDENDDEGDDDDGGNDGGGHGDGGHGHD